MPPQEGPESHASPTSWKERRRLKREAAEHAEGKRIEEYENWKADLKARDKALYAAGLNAGRLIWIIVASILVAELLTGLIIGVLYALTH